MAIPHAKSGEVVEIRPLGPALATSQTSTLVKTPTLEVIRLVLQPGKEICHQHAMAGEVLIQCLEGRIAVRVDGDRARPRGRPDALPRRRVAPRHPRRHRRLGAADHPAPLTGKTTRTPSPPRRSPCPHPQAEPGEVIDVRPLETAPADLQLITLVKTATLEVRRLILPKGREIPAHRAPGEITVHCLQGRVAFTAGGTTRDLAAGQMLYLDAGDPHALVGLEDSSLLVTKLLRPPAGT